MSAPHPSWTPDDLAAARARWQALDLCERRERMQTLMAEGYGREDVAVRLGAPVEEARP